MPQTRFVLRKAFANELRPIVVINKIDRPDARPDEVLNEVFDLFVELGADEHQLDFPFIFASGRAGFASHDPTATSGDIRPLFDLILEKVPGPEVDPDGPLADALHDARLHRVRRPDRHRPDRLGPDPAGPEGRARSRPAAGRHPRLDRQRPGLRQARPRRGRAGRGRRHRGRRRARRRRHRRHDRRRRAAGRPAPDRGRRADPEHDLQRQRLAVDRRGAVPDLAPPQGAARPRAGVERRPAGRADRGARRVHRLRPRPAAPLGPDRDDAARGLRAGRRQARGHHQGDRRGRPRADRVPRRRRPARPDGAGDGAGREPARRALEDGRQGGLRPPGVHDPRPRPARPAHPADERHAGRGDHAPQLPRLPAACGATSRAGPTA